MNEPHGNEGTRNCDARLTRRPSTPWMLSCVRLGCGGRVLVCAARHCPSRVRRPRVQRRRRILLPVPRGRPVQELHGRAARVRATLAPTRRALGEHAGAPPTIPSAVHSGALACWRASPYPPAAPLPACATPPGAVDDARSLRKHGVPWRATVAGTSARRRSRCGCTATSAARTAASSPTGRVHKPPRRASCETGERATIACARSPSGGQAHAPKKGDLTGAVVVARCAVCVHCTGAGVRGAHVQELLCGVADSDLPGPRRHRKQQGKFTPSPETCWRCSRCGSRVSPTPRLRVFAPSPLQRLAARHTNTNTNTIQRAQLAGAGLAPLCGCCCAKKKKEHLLNRRGLLSPCLAGVVF